MLLHTVIQSLRPGKEFTMFDDDLSTIVWNEQEVITPTQEEIDAARIALEAKEISDKAEAEAKRQALLDKLGITEEEARLLLGGN